MAGVGRRAVLGAGSVAVAGVVLGAGEAAVAAPEQAQLTPAQVRRRVARIYERETSRVGGTWHSYLSLTNPDGTATEAVAQSADTVVEAYSVNKVPVAVAVLDKVDRGLLALDDTVQVTADIIVQGGDGIFYLDRAYPSSVTIGHALAALLTISDDTAVRLSGLVAPALEINQILRDKGFPNTQVQPVSNPNRFFLGLTTPREMHDLLRALVAGDLLSPESTDHLLAMLRSPIAFTDGIRREMSSAERARVATKAGWFADGRNEAGVIFDQAGAPVLTYAMFATHSDQQDNYGATHPLVQARARMGRRFLDATAALAGPPTEAVELVAPQPYNGG